MRGPEAVLETALYARNLDETAGFYADVIGLREHSRSDGRHVFFECGPGMVMLFNPDATELPGGKLPVPPHGARGRWNCWWKWVSRSQRRPSAPTPSSFPAGSGSG